MNKASPAVVRTSRLRTAKFPQITIYGGIKEKTGICDRYKGVTSGEPSKTGSGLDGTHCLYSTSDVTYR